MATADVRIVPAQAEHIAPLAQHARAADVAELWAAARLTPEGAMRIGLPLSPLAWTGFVGDDTVCMFGVTPVSLLGGVGAPWLIGTEHVERYQMAFLRHSRPMVAAMLQRFPLLINHVDARNTVAVRWLRWLGFAMAEPAPYGPFGVPFRKFEMRA